MKTLALSEKTHKELMTLKIEYNYSSAEDMVIEMLVEFKKERLLEASRIFREALHKKGMTIEEVMEASKNIKREVVNETLNRHGH